MSNMPAERIGEHEKALAEGKALVLPVPSAPIESEAPEEGVFAKPKPKKPAAKAQPATAHVKRGKR